MQYSPYDYEEVEDYGWHWYYVSAHHPILGTLEIDPWPVCAEGFQEAMDVFEVVVRMSIEE